MTHRRCKDCAGIMVEDELTGVPIWRCTKCWRVDARDEPASVAPEEHSTA